jgi:multicomponent Na+:H+ antiporter subunit D
MPIALIAIAVSTLLNALYYVPVIFNLYSKRTDGKFEGVKADYHWEYVFAMVVFIILNLCFGTFSEPIVGAIRDGLAMFGM